ncbi:MAG TPA: dienelactone hydrolase family protein, partial [Iamia sp.]|nr:dienelactone hydrolase family protein [Iamia sp.]
MGQNVEFTNGDETANGYLSVPESGSGPGLIVIQEWWGLVDHIRDVCDRFAAEGFVALAPDFYHGETTSEPDEAGKLMMALNLDQAVADMSGAIA